MIINKNISISRFVVMTALLLTTYLVPAAYAAGGKATDIPRPFSQALSAYKKEGISGFMTALVHGSPLEGNREMRQQEQVLEKIEAYYGHYQSYDILRVNRLSESTRLIYFLLNYEKGPVFGTLTAFKSGDRETITSFQFHTKAEKIFPESLLIGR